ncbi:unnamed protein product, partial [Prunus brigantina]
MLVKSRTANDHLRNLALMFGKLKQYNMRLNPSKCAFGVASGKFLGFMISQRGIEANPEKIRALIDMQVPKTKKEVQSLTGRVAALSRFISKATDRCAPFFKALKGSKRQIDWTSECDRAFDDLKHYMSRAPLLSTPLPGETHFAVLAVDYFTKWTEAEALTTITTAKIEHFVWKNILCRFGLPNAIVTDNGKQFDCSRFRHLCSRFNISIFFASPAHPQSNGQVEAINKIIKKTLKKKLGAAKGNWPEILPEALWAINTSYRRSTGETPFSLAFGTEAVVPVEVHAPTCRTASYDPQQNENQLALNLDLIDEHRLQAQLRNATYKQRTARYYNSRVKHRSFKVGDWVLRKVSLATRNPTEGTLGP